MLLVPQDFFYLEFWLSLEFQLEVQVREKKFACRGSVKKSEKCLLVFTVLPSIFCTIVEKNLLRWLLFRTGFRQKFFWTLLGQDIMKKIAYFP